MQVVKAHRIDKDENGKISGIDGKEKTFICKIDKEPLYWLEGLDNFLYKGKIINFYIFTKDSAKSITEHYCSRKLLTEAEKSVFLTCIENNINPYLFQSLIDNLVQRAKQADYALTHNVIPDYLTFETWFPISQENLTIEELKAIFEINIELLEKNNIQDQFSLCPNCNTPLIIKEIPLSYDLHHDNIIHFVCPKCNHSETV